MRSSQNDDETWRYRLCHLRETIDDATPIAKGAVELSIEDLREKSEEIPTGEGVLEYIVDVHI